MTKNNMTKNTEAKTDEKAGQGGVTPSLTFSDLEVDGWQKTPEVRPNGVSVYEKVIDGVRQYKEVGEDGIVIDAKVS